MVRFVKEKFGSHEERQGTKKLRMRRRSCADLVAAFAVRSAATRGSGHDDIADGVLKEGTAPVADVLDMTSNRALGLLVWQLPRRLLSDGPANSNHNRPVHHAGEKHQPFDDAFGRQVRVGDKPSFSPKKCEIGHLDQNRSWPEPVRSSKPPERGYGNGDSEDCARNPKILTGIAPPAHNKEADKPNCK